MSPELTTLAIIGAIVGTATLIALVFAMLPRRWQGTLSDVLEPLEIKIAKARRAQLQKRLRDEHTCFFGKEELPATEAERTPGDAP